MSAAPGLAVRADAGILTLTLDRPERRNALTAALLAALLDELRSVGEGRHKDVRVVVITGSGTHFCSGADTGELLSDADRSELVELSWAMIGALADAPVPVVAALNGPAIAGGVELALSCDLRLATRTAGLRPRGMAWGAATCTRLARHLPLGLATEMVWLGRDLDAAACERWGLVSAVVDGADALMAEAAALASRLAALPTRTLVGTRALLRDSAATWPDLLAGQARLSAAAWVTDDAGARLRSAVEAQRTVAATDR